MLLSALTEDPWIEVLHKGSSIKAGMISLCTRMLSSYDSIQSYGGHFDIMWVSFAMEPLREAYSRVDRFCRCMMHMFCADVPQGVANTADTDVTFFLETESGNELFERSVKKIFRDPSLWWSHEIAEMKKPKPTPF